MRFQPHVIGVTTEGRTGLLAVMAKSLGQREASDPIHYPWLRDWTYASRPFPLCYLHHILWVSIWKFLEGNREDNVVQKIKAHPTFYQRPRSAVGTQDQDALTWDTEFRIGFDRIQPRIFGATGRQDCKTKRILKNQAFNQTT